MSSAKQTERAELHKTIWRIANDLRGSVDGWDFKTYVSGMLFYRFISENLTSYLNEQERRAGVADFDYATLSDADAEFGSAETVKEKVFTSRHLSSSRTCAPVRGMTRTSTKHSPASLPTSKARPPAPIPRTTSRACSTTST